jgi:hypothetical protein
MKPWGAVHDCCGFKRLKFEYQERLTKTVLESDLESEGDLKRRVLLNLTAGNCHRTSIMVKFWADLKV